MMRCPGLAHGYAISTVAWGEKKKRRISGGDRLLISDVGDLWKKERLKKKH